MHKNLNNCFKWQLINSLWITLTLQERCSLLTKPPLIIMSITKLRLFLHGWSHKPVIWLVTDGFLSVVSSNPLKAFFISLSKDTLPSLLSTGCLQEQIRAWLIKSNENKIVWSKLKHMYMDPSRAIGHVQTGKFGRQFHTLRW